MEPILRDSFYARKRQMARPGMKSIPSLSGRFKLCSIMVGSVRNSNSPHFDWRLASLMQLINPALVDGVYLSTWYSSYDSGLYCSTKLANTLTK